MSSAVYTALSYETIGARFETLSRFLRVQQWKLGEEGGFSKSRLSLVKSKNYATNSLKELKQMYSKDHQTQVYWREQLRRLIFFIDLHMVMDFTKWLYTNGISIQTASELIVPYVENSSLSLKMIEDLLLDWVEMKLSMSDRAKFDQLIGNYMKPCNAVAFQFDVPVFRHTSLPSLEKNRLRPVSEYKRNAPLYDCMDWTEAQDLWDRNMAETYFIQIRQYPMISRVIEVENDSGTGNFSNNTVAADLSIKLPLEGKRMKRFKKNDDDDMSYSVAPPPIEAIQVKIEAPDAFDPLSNMFAAPMPLLKKAKPMTTAKPIVSFSPASFALSFAKKHYPELKNFQ